MCYKNLVTLLLAAGIFVGCEDTSLSHTEGTVSGGTATHKVRNQNQDTTWVYTTPDPGRDIARIGKATQGSGSDYQYYQPASNAIDGDETTFNHTSGSDKENWLQIALPKGTKIGKIVIVSRKGFESRIAGAKVYLRDTPYTGTLEGEPAGTLKGTSDPQRIVFDPQKQKEYVVIKAVAGKPLHLTSVNIFGSLLENPFITAYKKRLLVNYDTPVGKQITTVKAKDLQGDTLHYSLNDGVPFSIDNRGNIFVAKRLQPNAHYTLTVTVSDGKSATSTEIEVRTTSEDALKYALETGDASGVTKMILMKAFEREIAQHHAGESDYMTIKSAVDKFYRDGVHVDFSKCSRDYKHIQSVPKDGKCISENSFIEAMPMIHKKLAALEKKKIPFKDVDDVALKLLVLLGDKYRQEVSFEGDPTERGEAVFLRSVFADYTVYSFRAYNPAQPDMGNYSRSTFPGVPRIDKTVQRTSRPPFRSTGLYAFPGETFTVKRTDNDSAIHATVFVGTLRADATHMFNKYRRPRYLQGAHYTIAPGETLRITSCYGGPIEIGFRGAETGSVTLAFDHVGEHPYWRSSADDTKFQNALDANRFDWAELSTPGFEVHSKTEKMQESIKNWAKQNETIATYSAQTASNLANATIHFTSNYPFGLAGYKASSIDPIAEMDSFADENGLSVKTINFVKHMNADQAACGYGCSGNPYDAFWAFSPTSHGDIHEIGHSLQAGAFLLTIRDTKWGGHAATNPYSYYTKSKYYMETGGEPGCSTLPFEKAFNALNSAAKSSDTATSMYDNFWKTSSITDQFMMTLQSMMSVQQMGKEGTITGDHRIAFGWHLLGRVHLLLREFKAARDSDTAWAGKKDALGFGSYTRAEAKQLSNNDIMIILYSKAAYADFREYWDMWGVPYSSKASAQIAGFGYPKVPKRFFFSTSDGYCKDDAFSQSDALNPLDKRFVTVDGNGVWPTN